jgi:hypothetical protein
MNNNISTIKYIIEDDIIPTVNSFSNEPLHVSSNSLQVDSTIVENNIEDKVNFVFILSGPYRKDPTHVFKNIIQPRKPLSFLPLEIFLSPLIPTHAALVADWLHLPRRLFGKNRYDLPIME